MFKRMKVTTTQALLVATVAAGLFTGEAHAQLLREDFDAVTGNGGGIFHAGPGYGDTDGMGWDNGITGESAFGDTAGNIHAEFSAQGVISGPINGTGAGQLSIANITRSLLDNNLGGIEDEGPVTVVQGDGVTADTTGFVTEWNSGLFGEGAFGGTADGAILVGDITVEGCLDCGESDSEGAIVTVDNVNLNGSGNWFAGLWLDLPGFPPGSGPFLFNGGFERNGGSFDPWVAEGNSSAAQTTPRTGTNDLKMFGNFTGAYNTTLAYQDVPAGNGETWELECWVRHNNATGDPVGDFMRDGQTLEMKIAFFDSFDNVINSTGVLILDEADTTDVWIQRGPISLTSVSPNTQYVRAEFKFSQPGGQSSGAALIDDISFRRTDGGAAADLTAFLAQFEVSAQVKGTANGGAGEVLGDVQIRIEDTDGDRLVYSAPASTVFQSLGDTLDMFVEQNDDELNSNGAFNPASDSFRVVVAFDNLGAPTWGTGGVLAVDDLFFSNSFASSDDNYVAALIWDGIPSLGVDNLAKLFVQADVIGSVAGGNYQVRVEGYNAIGELTEDFSSISTDSENQIVGPNDPGGEFRNWTDEISYDIALFGLGGGGGVVTSTGGVFARTCLTCGESNSEAIQLEVLDVAPNADGNWYAGFIWENRSLGSSDLSAVTLQADIAGSWNPGFLQGPVEYTLRIEDPDGDYIGFDGVFASQDTFITVGGPLSDFNTNGTVSGNDGVFDVDTEGAAYKVVIIFIGRGSNEDPPFGNFGGTITVDNLSLTPGGDPVMVQAGVVGFDGVATGALQTIGGVLADATISTFFGVGGLFQGYTPDWDSVLEGEGAFAGTWGAGLMAGTYAEGCTDCGTNGTGGGTYYWDGSGNAGAGGWWIGVVWPSTFQFTAPNQVRLVGDFRMEWDEQAGQNPGFVYFKIESSPNNMREFAIAATNGWVHIDDTLDNANPVGTLVFGSEQEYSLVISCYGIDGNGDWGTGGRVYFDDLALIVNGQTIFEEDFDSAAGPGSTVFENDEGEPLDEYTVVVSVENGIETWGTSGGTLTVDNLNLALAASCDGDADLDLADAAAFQRCMGSDGTGDCECADTDADGDVDLADYKVFEMFFDGPG